MAVSPKVGSKDWLAYLRVRWRNPRAFRHGPQSGSHHHVSSPRHVKTGRVRSPAPGFPVVFMPRVQGPIDREHFQATAEQRDSSKQMD